MKEPFYDLEYAAKYFLLLIYLGSMFFSAISVKDGIYKYEDLHAMLIVVTQFLFVTAVPISFHHAWGHLSAFNKPKLQSQIIRIIWMVPVFCFESYLSLLFVSQATYFQAVRELYEAYVIHCFMRLIIQYMCGEEEGHSAVVNRLAMYPASMGVHKPPFCCLTPWQMGSDFVFKCKTGVFQYVVVRFFNSILTMILFTLGLYKEGSFSISQPFLWITAVNFCSQSWALYSLLLFFLCAHKELHGMRPFSKFACIKLIIFFSWWQALLIGIMVRAGRINQGYGHSAQEIAVFIRATLISAEMVLAAVAFVYAFPVNEFALSISVGARSHSSSHSSGGKKLKHISFTRWNTATAITASAVSSLSKGCQQLLPGSTHHASNRMNTSSTSTLGANPRGGEPAVVQPLAQKLLQQASKVLEYWSVGAKGSNATAATDSNEPERCGTKTSAGTTWANKNTIRLPPGGSCDSLVSLLAKQRDYQHIHSDLEAGVQLSDLPLENELRHHAETEAAALSSPGQAIIMLGELRALEGFDSEGGEQSKPLKPLRSPNKRGGGCAQVQDEECILAEEEEEEEGGRGKGKGKAPYPRTASPQRAHFYFNRKDDTSFEDPNLMTRASPGLTRNRRDSTPTGAGRHPSHFRSNSSADRTATATSNLPTNRSLEHTSFHRHCEVHNSDLSDNLSRASSENSTDSTCAATPTHRPDSNPLDLSSLTTTHRSSWTRGAGTRRVGKGRAATTSSSSTSVLQNLWMSTLLPVDLQEDIGDLEAQLVELYHSTVPSINFKRAIKGSFATN